MDATLIVHIAAGLVAIVGGYVALATAKGLRAHRSSGRVFLYSMIGMALLGAWIAATRGKAPEANVPIGLLTTYLVITGFTAIRPPRGGSRALELSLAALVVAIGAVLIAFGVQAAQSPTGNLHSVPTLPFFIFAGVALLSGAGDVRLIRSGGAHLLRGTPRLRRHLWRMCFAHLVAAFAFFPRLARVIPKSYPVAPLVLAPSLIVLGAMLYWLWRVRQRGAVRAAPGLSTSPATS